MASFQCHVCFILVEEVSGSASAFGQDMENSTYSISLPGEAFENVTDEKAGAVFSFYSTSVLFPLRINLTDVVLENSTYKTIGSSVISATIAKQTITNLKYPVVITMEVTTYVSTAAIHHHKV